MPITAPIMTDTTGTTSIIGTTNITVSIVTVSQYSRVSFLKILSKCISQQDYPNIIEWIIIDTSFVGYNQTETDLTEMIDEFEMDTNLPPIIYYQSKKSFIGGWRNEYNSLASGNIIVCMDDDDYYPPQRISHSVEVLADKTKLIAGCPDLYIYDIHFKKFYQYSYLNQTIQKPKCSLTNNTIAYWKEYLKNHIYDETVHNAEEESFIQNSYEEAAFLDPEKTILHFSHDLNTYNKKKLIYINHHLPENKKYIFDIDCSLDKFISNQSIRQDYINLFKKLSEPKQSCYDIVYFCGLSIPWSPLENNLGGSEQSVKYLSEEWARLGKKVAVFGTITHEGTTNGVDYFEYKKFRFWDKYKIIILWRLCGCLPYLTLDLDAQKIFIDLHDNNTQCYNYVLKNNHKVTNWMTKSDFQKNFIEQTISNQLSNIVVIPNGVRIDEFSKQIDVTRNPFRLCYCSCYTRGLYRILNNIWPIVYKFEPRAELHIYYGMHMIHNLDFKKTMQILLSQPGVMDHGRQPVEIINREKHLSSFHLYYTDTLAEIDCISIKESLVAGCIPIISDIHLFKHRDGIRINWLPNTEDFNKQIACTIVELMHNGVLQQELRNKYSKSETIMSWKQCAEEWMKYF